MIPERFKRTSLLLGEEAYEKLHNSHVTIIGLGAVGFHSAEALVRSGLGSIRLADFDIIRESNLNRQLLALHSTLGKSKVQTARERLLEINPNLKVEAFESFFHEESYPKIFAQPTDIVLDAIDSFSPKLALLQSLYHQGIPVISSMGAARRTDPFAIRVGDISKTLVCPLAARIRRTLRRKGIARGIRCVYSLETPPPQDFSLEEGEEEYYKRGRPRRPQGSIAHITGIFGYIAAGEILNHLLEMNNLTKNNGDGISQ